MTSFKFVTILSIVLIFIFCTNNNAEKNLKNTMIVKGTIKGLRKGTLFLQKIKDTSLINIDSVTINGKPYFEFNTPIETAEIFYLYLDKEDGDSLNDRILFFGEKNTIEINTLLNTFESSAKISGSKNQELLQEYQTFNRKFNDQNLELMKSKFLAKADGKNKIIDSLQIKIDNLLKRRYLYTINFAAQNANENVAPYLALTQVFDANLALLDSIAFKMTQEVKNSKYGKEFLIFLEKRRKNEISN